MITETSNLTDRCRRRLDRLRPTFLLFQDVLELLEDEPLQQVETHIGLHVLRMMSTELRRHVEQLDLDLHHGIRAPLGDFGHDSEGGEL